MSEFSAAYKLTSVKEGGYVNDTLDRGGETYAGIARNFDESWRGWVIVDKYKSHKDFPSILSTDSSLQQLVIAYFKANYWNSLNLSDIADQRMANEIYDSAVNLGVATTGLFFQRVLNALNKDHADLKLDGQVGAKTIATFNALSQSDQYIIWKLFNCLQGVKYINICEYNVSQRKFIRGWASRVF